MFPLNLKSSIGMAILCFVLGCCTAFLLTANCNGPSKQTAVNTANILKAKVVSLHAHYRATITDLETRNQQLSRELQSTKAELAAAKTKTNKKAAEIKRVLKPIGYPAKELLKKTSVSFVPENPALEKCDSLAMLVSEFLQDDEHKDSLYEVHITQQDSLMKGKDDIIALQESENTNLSFLFKQSLEQQSVLEKDNFKLRKKLRRQKARGKWLTIGAAILTGVVTNYLSNR